jgi:hypothetical protein
MENRKGFVLFFVERLRTDLGRFGEETPTWRWIIGVLNGGEQ